MKNLLNPTVGEILNSKKETPIVNKVKHTTTTVSVIPNCDICSPDLNVSAVYDGRTTQGSWAFMCEKHFKQIGRGLGLGLGQRLELEK